MTITDLFKNREGAIVIFATPEDIAARRREIEKQRADALAALPAQSRLIDALMRGGTAARAAISSTELAKAQKRATEMLARYGAPTSPLCIEVLMQLEIENAYLDRIADLDRIEKRSEASRFAVAAQPARPGMH